jgi:hypothetical protein
LLKLLPLFICFACSVLAVISSQNFPCSIFFLLILKFVSLLRDSKILASGVLYRAQVVGWPPIRSYRKNTMATNQQKISKEDSEAKPGQGFLYVKVSMDGAPYLRKIDLKTYKNYKELSIALEKMFSGFSTGEMSRVTLWFCKVVQYIILRVLKRVVIEIHHSTQPFKRQHIWLEVKH